MGRWIEVRYLKAGMEIAVPDYSTSAIKWEKISSIKQLEPQHVYDLSIEGTRNFIANDIVAHNTYLATASGNVGIGTTAPATVLDVKGKANFTGNFSVGQTSNIFFVDNTSGRVGIGITNPGVLGGTTFTNVFLHVNASSGTGQMAMEGVTRGAMLLRAGQGAADNRIVQIRLDALNSGDNGLFQIGKWNDAEGTFTNFIAIPINTGNVGIGTTAPGRLLEVAGSINGTQLNISGATNLAYGSGNVGIGTTSPTTLLGLAGSGDFANFSLTSSSVDIRIGTSASYSTIQQDLGTDDFVIQNNRSASDSDIVFKTNAAERVRITGGGNVGIGTTAPQNLLDVAGAATFAKGVNASNLNVTGFSITDDSLVTLSDGSKKKIKDIKAGEEVLTLDEKTSKLVPRKVNALLDHGIKPIYEMATEDGRAINTTAEHPYFVRKYQSIILMPSSARIQVLPLNLSENLSNHCRNKDSHLEISGGCTRITTIAGNSAGGNKDVFKRSLSNDNIALPSSHANRYNLEFLMPFSAYLISMPLSESDLINLASISSSEKNLNFKVDKPLTSEFFSSVVQGSPDMLLSQRRISFENIFKGFSSFEHLEDLRDPDSGAFESWLSTANFTISDNKLINFGSHEVNNDNSVYKYYENNGTTFGDWIEVRYLKVGMEIAVPDYSTGAIKWEKIASIKQLEPQHVYDLSIDGTRNFIANDIVAHNTYLATSSGNVGIGITAPATVLDVKGKANFTGNFSVGQTSNIFFVDNTSKMVGINQTLPTSMLHIGSSSANADSSALRVQDADGNCFFNPEATDQPWTCSSDARLKENIKDAAPTLPYLLGIPIKDFTVIASGDNKTGVVAQDLLDKYPELVHMDNDGYYMVDGMNSWKLVKAIQEQQAQIEELKKEIEELKKS